MYESRKSLALHFILTCNNFFLPRSSLFRALLSFLFPCSFSLAVWIDLVLLSYTPAICFSSTSISFMESSVFVFIYFLSAALILTHMQTHKMMHPMCSSISYILYFSKMEAELRHSSAFYQLIIQTTDLPTKGICGASGVRTQVDHCKTLFVVGVFRAWPIWKLWRYCRCWYWEGKANANIQYNLKRLKLNIFALCAPPRI